MKILDNDLGWYEVEHEYLLTFEKVLTGICYRSLPDSLFFIVRQSPKLDQLAPHFADYMTLGKTEWWEGDLLHIRHYWAAPGHYRYVPATRRDS